MLSTFKLFDNVQITEAGLDAYYLLLKTSRESKDNKMTRTPHNSGYI